ncbi:MAG: hypothetical protein AAF589_07910 [Planctomycetota bacterium]
MLPRFSLRIALIVLTAGSVLSIVFAAAWRDELWAKGAVMGLAAALLMLALQVLLWAVAQAAGRLLTSPHAPDVLNKKPDALPAVGEETS